MSGSLLHHIFKEYEACCVYLLLRTYIFGNNVCDIGFQENRDAPVYTVVIWSMLIWIFSMVICKTFLQGPSVWGGLGKVCERTENLSEIVEGVILWILHKNRWRILDAAILVQYWHFFQWMIPCLSVNCDLWLVKQARLTENFEAYSLDELVIL